MGDLILETRIDMLRSNLEGVARVLLPVQQHRDDVLRAQEIEAISGAAVVNIGTYLKMAHVGVDGRIWEIVQTAIENIEKELAPLSAALAERRAASDGPRSRWPNIRGAFSEALERSLMQRASDQLDALADLAGTLSNGGGVPSRTPNGDKRAPDWETRFKNVALDAEEVFAEYVDLLGGLALRDSGFDGGICMIADELIRGCNPGGNFTWSSITIPARQEALSRTLAQIIRIGFPEWTVWALPLTAHELGHVVVAPKGERPGSGEQGILSEAHKQQIYRADAFATRAMGPAYACAAVLLRLNPFGPDPHHTMLRAAVIFEMLQRMQEGPLEAALKPIRTQLQDEWADLKRKFHISDELTADDQSEVQRVADWTIKEFGPYVRFKQDAWRFIEQIAVDLDRDPDSVTLLSDYELRYVLNAAWKRRLDDPHPSVGRVDKIAKSAIALMVRIGEATKAGESGQPAGSQSAPTPPPSPGAFSAPKSSFNK